jgi:hypothetical protein
MAITIKNKVGCFGKQNINPPFAKEKIHLIMTPPNLMESSLVMFLHLGKGFFPRPLLCLKLLAKVHHDHGKKKTIM